MVDIILDTLLDTLKLIPFLFFTYLLMEFIEHKAGEKAERVIGRSGSYGPILGALLGVVPQCGFSAAASGLFSGGVISAGTLIAIFLATSDEMIPICVSEKVEALVIIKILINKVVIGLICGFAVDIVLKISKKPFKKGEIHCLCEDDNCHCEEGGILKSAIHHTLHVAVFILIITFVLNILMFFIGEDRLSQVFVNIPVVGCAVSSLIGIIPNCAASVIITELYLSDIISAGCMMSGLLAGSGLGILVLFRTNKNPKQNIKILLTVYIVSIIIGSMFDLFGITF